MLTSQLIHIHIADIADPMVNTVANEEICNCIIFTQYIKISYYNSMPQGFFDFFLLLFLIIEDLLLL